MFVILKRFFQLHKLKMGERVYKHKHKRRKHSDSVTTTSCESDIHTICDSDTPKSIVKRASCSVEDSAAQDGNRCLKEGVDDRKGKHKHKKHRKDEERDEEGGEEQATVSGIEESSGTDPPMGSARSSKKSKKRKRTTEENEVTGEVNAGSDCDLVSMETVKGASSSEHKAKRIRRSTVNGESVQVNGEQLGQSGGEEQFQEKFQKSKKRGKTGTVPTPQGGGVGKESALQYLHSWEKKDEWSFKKKIQYWLLQHMYDKHQVSVGCIDKDTFMHGISYIS